MGFFKKSKDRSEPYNPYATSNTPSTATPAATGDRTGFANALSPGAQPPQPYVPTATATPVYVSAAPAAPLGASAPPASFDPHIYSPHSSLPAMGNAPMGAGAGQPPKKYVKINGVMKLNPEYKRWKDAQSGIATPNPVSAQALPVVCNMDDHAQLNQDLGQDVPLAESTNATIEMMQEPEISLGTLHACAFVVYHSTSKSRISYACLSLSLSILQKLAWPLMKWSMNSEEFSQNMKFPWV